MFLLALTLKTAVVLGGCGLAALLLSRASAASRHAVWLAGLAGALAVAIGMIALPQWGVTVAATVDVVTASEPIAKLSGMTWSPHTGRWRLAISQMVGSD